MFSFILCIARTERFHFLIAAALIFLLRRGFLGTCLERVLGSIDLDILGLASLFLDIIGHLSSEAFRGINMLL